MVNNRNVPERIVNSLRRRGYINLEEPSKLDLLFRKGTKRAFLTRKGKELVEALKEEGYTS